MAATTTSFSCLLSLILLLSLTIKGSCVCSLNNINIGTSRTGRVVQGKPEWRVTVINNCNCAQSSIVLSCVGFQTAETVDRSILSVQGDVCLFINGRALQGSQSYSFNYAWDPPFLLLPKSSVVGACS